MTNNVIKPREVDPQIAFQFIAAFYSSRGWNYGVTNYTWEQYVALIASYGTMFGTVVAEFGPKNQQFDDWYTLLDDACDVLCEELEAHADASEASSLRDRFRVLVHMYQR